MTMLTKIRLRARDVSAQKEVALESVPTATTVRELLEGLVPRMHLPPNDSQGRPLSYSARLEREGRHLHGSEIVGESLQEGDELTVSPNIDAGGPAF